MTVDRQDIILIPCLNTRSIDHGIIVLHILTTAAEERECCKYRQLGYLHL